MDKQGLVAVRGEAVGKEKQGVSSDPKFIVDAMLGDLARWLRMLGYDTIYAKSMPDSRIIELARRDERIVLTRDHALFYKALKKGIRALVVSGHDTAERLAQVARRIGIRLYLDPDLTRCPLCNASLARVPKSSVKGRVPPIVYERYTEFWICTGCGQVYWRGSHWRGIEEILNSARQILKQWRGRKAQRSRAKSSRKGQPR